MSIKLIEKYRAWRAGRNQIEPNVAIAIFISVLALAVAAGCLRWSWLLMDEQVRLRQDFMNLKGSQDQLNIQYEFWNRQVQQERAELQKLKGLQ